MSNDKELDQNDDDLDYVRGIRKRVISAMVDKGIPNDPDELRALQTFLSDMDRTALGRKRVSVEKQSVNVQAQAAAVIAQLYSRSDLKKVGTDGVRTQSVELPDNLLEFKVVPGETDIVAPLEDYESFMKRTSQSE